MLTSDSSRQSSTNRTQTTTTTTTRTSYQVNVQPRNAVIDTRGGRRVENRAFSNYYPAKARAQVVNLDTDAGYGQEKRREEPEVKVGVAVDLLREFNDNNETKLMDKFYPFYTNLQFRKSHCWVYDINLFSVFFFFFKNEYFENEKQAKKLKMPRWLILDMMRQDED